MIALLFIPAVLAQALQLNMLFRPDLSYISDQFHMMVPIRRSIYHQ